MSRHIRKFFSLRAEEMFSAAESLLDVDAMPAPPAAEAVYLPVDAHYVDKLGTELDCLGEHESRLIDEIEQREKRLGEVRRSKVALILAVGSLTEPSVTAIDVAA